jgi:hypothetical protein
MKFYHITQSEIDDYFNLKCHSYEDMESLLNWIKYRRNHPFRSYCQQWIGTLIVEILKTSGHI